MPKKASSSHSSRHAHRSFFPPVVPSSEEEREVTELTTDDEESELDEPTRDLFDQLERGYKHYRTDILRTIQNGANLFVKQLDGDFPGCYPIHVAAHNVGSNTGAIKEILRSFDDPEARKQCIDLRNNDEETALEILFKKNDFECAISSIKAILSFLTHVEQQEIINNLPKDILKQIQEEKDDSYKKITCQSEIVDFPSLSYFLSEGCYIDTCSQRRAEMERDLAGYDSGEESLGQMGQVCNKKFTAKVSYQEIKEGGISRSIPELALIPSGWRHETNDLVKDQGDHVTAYVLLLCSFSHCAGENIKSLPRMVYNLAVSVLPDYQPLFEAKLKQNRECLDDSRQLRITTLASLRAFANKSEDNLEKVEQVFKRDEINQIAEHIEDTIHEFITIVNKLEGETFASERKKSLTKTYLFKELQTLLNTNPVILKPRYAPFKAAIFNTLQKEIDKKSTKTAINGEDIKRIINAMVTCNIPQKHIPSEFRKADGTLNKSSFERFLNDHIPCKKYHEGAVINEIKQTLDSLMLVPRTKQRISYLENIGVECFKLFDYPRVADRTLNDEHTLYHAIARHWIIINAAFAQLKKLSSSEKETIYDTFLNTILQRQLWYKQEVSSIRHPGKMRSLNLALLKSKVLTIANQDADYNFSIKPSGLPQVANSHSTHSTVFCGM